MRRRRLIRAVAGILRALREAGGGTGRITMREGRPVLGSSGPAVLVPADMSDREISSQAELYAGDLIPRQSGRLNLFTRKTALEACARPMP